MRSTPCVGICSTTYGDLVCRGCKRFSHEIVAWNVYTDDQRERVWTAAAALRDAGTAAFVTVSDERCCVRSAGIAASNCAQRVAAFARAMNCCGARRAIWRSVNDIGLVALDASRVEPIAVRDAIDTEFHLRSVAYYEHSFHTPVDS